VGLLQPPEEVEEVGNFPLLRPIQPLQTEPVGLCHRDSGAYLLKFAWTRIVRHQMVPGTASPDDPALSDYSAKRRRKNRPQLDGTSLRLLQAQHGRCPACRGLLLHAEHEPTTLPEWEQWLTVTRKAVRKKAITAQPVTPGGLDDPVALQLGHAHYQQRRSAIAVSLPGKTPATQ
jgi:RNA-directed DNA polymerase